MKPDEYHLRQEIVKIGQLLYQKGLISASEGNISARLDANRLLITPSGLHKGLVDTEHILVIDETGQMIGPRTGAARKLKPTSELPMHLEAYRQRPSLVQHVQAVGDALRLSLGDGQRTVAMIVGRDTAVLDRSGVARSAIESAAENFSDGVIATAFWFLLGGLPGLLLYKITNTADSMIGHLTPRHREFGWGAARFDDLLNLVPARLSAVLISLSHGLTDPRPILRDAPLHRSPNAGWPEAAMAVALDVAISGPRSYHGRLTDYPWVWPEGRHDLGPDDIDRTVAALWRD